MVFLNVKNKTIDNLLLFLNTGKPKLLSYNMYPPMMISLVITYTMLDL